MSKVAVITQRIRDEAKQLRLDLYGKDISKAYTTVTEFLDKQEELFKLANSWLDNKLIELACSKYTLSVVNSMVIIILAIGIAIGYIIK